MPERAHTPDPRGGDAAPAGAPARQQFLPLRSLWVWLAAAIALGGPVGALIAARAVAASNADHARLAFHLTSTEIAASLKQAIQHEEDLVVAASGFVRSDPRVSSAEFERWIDSVDAMGRYPELENIGLAEIVPASELRAFAGRQATEPLRALGAHWTAPRLAFRIEPAGKRPYYCLAVAGLARSTASFIPPGVDYCALSPQLISARELAQPAYAPFSDGHGITLGVETPVYRGVGRPATAAARARAFLGWLGELITPRVLLDRAMQGHPGLPLSLRYESRFSHVAFARGRVPPDARSMSIGLLSGREALLGAGEGWTLRTFAAPISSGVLDSLNSFAVLLGGSLLSLTIGLLTLALSSGRGRALRELSRKNRELSHQALHDTLTALPNRALVLDRAEQMLARVAREPEMLAGVLFIDIDDFKAVNDNLGHAAGDTVLSAVAARLRSTVRAQDTIGRLGGDEFVVLSELSGGEATHGRHADRRTEILREPVALGDDGRTISVTASIGVALGRYTSPDALLRDADLALYTAKAAGKDRHVLYEARMQEGHGRPGLEADLSAAVHGDQLFLLYQPICSLPSRELLGVEALVRWRHPQRGVIPPDEFIPLAEESGMIVAIGRWVLSEACRQATTWAAQGLRLGVSVNVSAYQVGQPGFTADVQRALRESGIEPSCLTLEITETAVMRNATAAREQLEQVKALGVRLAIDDFGTGYASLSSLQSLPVDILKIDRSFVPALSAGWGRELHKASELLHAIVGVGQALSLSVVAEGIERETQLQALEGIGCHVGQGYLLGRPSPPEAIESLGRELEALRSRA